MALNPSAAPCSRARRFAGSAFSVSKVLPSESEAFQPGNDRLIGEVGWIDHQQLGRIGVELQRRHLFICSSGGVTMSTAGSTKPLTGCRSLPHCESGVMTKPSWTFFTAG
jgi:hypothetical protein